MKSTAATEDVEKVNKTERVGVNDKDGNRQTKGGEKGKKDAKELCAGV